MTQSVPVEACTHFFGKYRIGIAFEERFIVSVGFVPLCANSFLNTETGIQTEIAHCVNQQLLV